ADIHAGASAAVGDWDQTWHSKIDTALEQAGTPAADREGILAQLSQSGLTRTQLQEFYSEKVAPGWDAEWQARFEALDLPAEEIAAARDSKAPNAQLQVSYDSMRAVWQEAKDDGRL